jgi:hypothetical protein
MPFKDDAARRAYCGDYMGRDKIRNSTVDCIAFRWAPDSIKGRYCVDNAAAADAIAQGRCTRDRIARTQTQDSLLKSACNLNWLTSYSAYW